MSINPNGGVQEQPVSPKRIWYVLALLLLGSAIIVQLSADHAAAKAALLIAARQPSDAFDRQSDWLRLAGAGAEVFGIAAWLTSRAKMPTASGLWPSILVLLYALTSLVVI